jgi:hypothetical protein
MRTLARTVLLALAFGIGTAVLGWWAIPLFALVASLLLRHVTRQALVLGAAASLAWAILLLWNAMRASLWTFAETAGGALGASALALIVVTLLFPGVLAWSIAGVVQWISRGKPGTN